MSLTPKLARLEKRLAALESATLPPAPIDFAWIPPEPCAPDEELVVTHIERSEIGCFRIISKRKKPQ